MRVAVLIPVYNDPVGLFKTLESLDNALGDFFVLVVNDGSTVDLIPNQSFDFEVKEIILQENSGIEVALNAGLDYLINIDCTYIARLDSGDTVMPERFLTQLDFFSENSDVSIVGSYIDVVDEDNNFIYQQMYPLVHEDICKLLRYQNQLCHPSVMFRSSIFKSGIRYPLNRPAAEDYALFFNLSKKHRIENIPLSLVKYVVSSNSISSRKRFRQCVSRLKVQVDYFDYADVNSYFGVARTLVLMSFPRKFSLMLKRLGFK